MEEKYNIITNMDVENDHTKVSTGNVFFQLIFSLIFVVLILTVPIMCVITPDKEKSELENRVLEQMPGLTLSSVTDGTFMDKFEIYMADQFPFRDIIMGIKSNIDIISGKRKINDVYVGDDGYLFKEPSKPDEDKLNKITSAMNKFINSHNDVKSTVAISPTASYILSDKMPSGIQPPKQDVQLSKIKNLIGAAEYDWIDCLKILNSIKDDTQVFYRTDHHWTTRSAYSIFESIAENWNLDFKQKTYEFFSVSDSFEGTLASSSGISYSTDIIEICIPYESGEKFMVDYESHHVKKATIFDKDKLSQKNQYEVFLGGNFDKIIISTDVDTKNSLIIIKDSYANCMISMFTPFFSEIVIIDPRYFNDSVNRVMQDYDFTHALFLYNLDTFLEDTSLADVFE